MTSGRNSRMRQSQPDSRSTPSFVQKHGKPIAVILDAEKYEQFLDYVEDLEDNLTVLEHELNPSDPSTYTPLEEVERELGLKPL